MRRFTIVLLMHLLPACAIEPPVARIPEPVSICAMIAAPEKFKDKLVVFNAPIESDGMHFTLLMDESCHRGIVLNWDRSAPPPEADRILDAIWQPWPSTMNKKIFGRFTGRLRFDQSNERWPYVFDITRIDDLKIWIGQRPW